MPYFLLVFKAHAAQIMFFRFVKTCGIISSFRRFGETRWHPLADRIQFRWMMKLSGGESVHWIGTQDSTIRTAATVAVLQMKQRRPALPYHMQCTYNVTLARSRNHYCSVKTTIIHISARVRACGCTGAGLCLRTCNFNYPARNAPPYCHLRPLWLHHIFRHYLTTARFS